MTELAIDGISRAADAGRVEATVDGIPVWYASDSLPLRAVPEAFLTLFTLPALVQRRLLRCPLPVSAEWVAQTGSMLPTWAGWLNVPPFDPLANLEMDSYEGQPGAGRTGLCFTGGIDSIYELLCGRHRPDDLLFVQGYGHDLPLGADAAVIERARMQAAMTRRVGTRAHVIRTNLMQHPSFDPVVSWNMTHGAALCALGMLSAGM